MENNKAKVCTKIVDVYFNALREMDVCCNNCLHALDIRKLYHYCPMIDSGVNKDFSCPEFIYKDDESCKKVWELIMKEVDKNWDQVIESIKKDNNE